MVYLYCEKCLWLQDDFWDYDWYNPIVDIEDEMLMDELFKTGLIEMQKAEAENRKIEYIEPPPGGTVKEGVVLIQRKDYVAAKLEESASRIRTMEFRTWKEFEEYKARNGMKCPECGELSLKLDEQP